MQRRAPGRRLLIATLGVATLTFNEACRNSVVANFPTCGDCDSTDSGDMPPGDAQAFMSSEGGSPSDAGHE